MGLGFGKVVSAGQVELERIAFVDVQGIFGWLVG